MADTIRVAVTGAAGQIAYSLLFRLASGEVFGADRKVKLQLLEIPPAMGTLEGVVMELEDCAFPSLAGVEITDKPKEAFDKVNWALLVGSRPRGPDMERSDLIKINGPIFVGQGKALNHSAKDVRVLVVGNPCNTNCMIAMRNSDVPADRFCAMMALDHNRGRSFLAKKADTTVEEVTRLAIWGNHSNNQYPDFENALIKGKPATEVINDEEWLRDKFVPKVQKRGAAVIKSRGASSAASAANAVIDTIHGFSRPTPNDDWFASAICSNGEYGVDKGLIFGYPLQTAEDGTVKIVPGLEFSHWGKNQFNKVLEELQSERELVKELL